MASASVSLCLKVRLKELRSPGKGGALGLMKPRFITYFFKDRTYVGNTSDCIS